jgi:2,4-dienoyl-CoA reductase-like NADH-dependent reductase (Old Yellow Enzyme family)
MSQLFTPIQLRSLNIKNRVFVSPMCQYSAEEGVAQDWHLVHLGGFAKGGAGLVMAEATAVSPEGRISPDDLGIWSDRHAEALKPVVRFLHSQFAVSAIQLAHAGRKAGTAAPWKGGKPVFPENGGWIPVGPSALPYKNGYQTPKEMNEADLKKVEDDYVQATHRSQAAGFQVVEVHMAHGYLFHEFLSPLSNHRKDQYGGSLENRMRFPLRVFERVRALWPQDLPVFVRISASDWVPGGWDVEQSVLLAKELKKRGADLIDVSSGGLSPEQKIEVKPLYQVPAADQIRRQAEIPAGAVGLITKAKQAEGILQAGQADAIFIAREMLRDPHWALRAAQELGAEVKWPVQYERAKPFVL